MSRDAVSKDNTIAYNINRNCGSDTSINKIISRVILYQDIIRKMYI